MRKNLFLVFLFVFVCSLIFFDGKSLKQGTTANPYVINYEISKSLLKRYLKNPALENSETVPVPSRDVLTDGESEKNKESLEQVQEKDFSDKYGDLIDSWIIYSALSM